MDQEDRIYTPKVISRQYYHGNYGDIIHSNQGDITQPRPTNIHDPVTHMIDKILRGWLIQESTF